MEAFCSNCKNWKNFKGGKFGSCSVLVVVKENNILLIKSSKTSGNTVHTFENFGCIKFEPNAVESIETIDELNDITVNDLEKVVSEQVIDNIS